MTNTLEVIQGDDKSWNLYFKDSNNNPINITNSIIYFTVKKKKDDSDALAVISKDIISHVTPTTGSSELILTHDDTNISIGDYYYDFQIEYSTGSISSLPMGIFKINQGITQRTS